MPQALVTRTYWTAVGTHAEGERTRALCEAMVASTEGAQRVHIKLDYSIK